MAKASNARKERKGKISPKPPVLPIIDNRPLVEILKQEEKWSEYDLADGNRLRVKPLVMDVHKTNLPGPDGNPQYNVRTTFIIDIQVVPKTGKKT